MSDDVNNPSHYNQQGIEVIDVIETYAKDDFRLANVIKYVCRCEYKGTKLQDLKKAQWYLDRVVEELDSEDLKENPPFGNGQDKIRGASYDNIAVDDLDYYLHAYEDLRRPAALSDDKEWCVRETQKFVDLYDPVKNLAKQATEAGSLYFHASPDRIAGDDAKASKIKDAYYGFDRYAIRGYCASCDAEIGAGQPFVASLDYEDGIMFCKQACVDSLRSWQAEGPCD